MNLRDLRYSALLTGSLLLEGCSSVFVVPLATIDNTWVYPYNERKNGQVVATGLATAPKGITLKGSTGQIFIDGGSRISPSTPDGIVDEYIINSHRDGKFIYNRTSYTGSDGVIYDLNKDDENTKKLRDVTSRTLDSATKEYQRYRMFLNFIGK